MTREEVMEVLNPLLPLAEDEKIEAIVIYTNKDVPGKGLVKDLKGTPAEITKTLQVACELGLNYGNTKYVAIKNANMPPINESLDAAPPKKKRANNKVWDIQNILCTNSNTKNTVLDMYVDKNEKFILGTNYEIIYPDGRKECTSNLPEIAREMKTKTPETASVKDEDGKDVFMPLMTLGVDKILQIKAIKSKGKFKVGK